VFRYPLLLTILASCGDWHLARKYFLPAFYYIPHPYAVAHWQKSEEFDYNSITIYPSSREVTGDPNPKYVLKTISGDLIFTGGHPNPEHAGLSRLDIERVAALYPIKHVNPQLIQNKPPGKRSSDANADAQIAKRWFSIPADQKFELPGGRRLWPKSGDGRHIVSYCFEDAESHHYLKDVFDKALAKWAPAIRTSSLTFAPDAACSGQQWLGRCLCSRDGVSVDTLRIQATDATIDATCGYTARPDGLRNILRFPKNQDKWGTVSMTHKLGKIASSMIFGRPTVMRMTYADLSTGHIIGFEHEHQRTDAGQYLSYDLEAFPEYQEVKARVENAKTEDEPLFTVGMSIEERMKLV
jgi:hypothetical protein